MAYPRQLTLDPGQRAAEDAADQLDQIRRQTRQNAYQPQRLVVNHAIQQDFTVATTMTNPQAGLYIPPGALVQCYWQGEVSQSVLAAEPELILVNAAAPTLRVMNLVNLSTYAFANTFATFASYPSSPNVGHTYATPTTNPGAMAVIANPPTGDIVFQVRVSNVSGGTVSVKNQVLAIMVL